MVSFSCEACGDVLTKKKLDPHRGRCRGATFTCIDCMVYFPGFEYRSHTACMTEDQKYQGALYKPKKSQQRPARPFETMNTLALQPTVEDIGEDKQYETWHECQSRIINNGRPTMHILPEAPTPPPAHEDDNVNVFDFLVATGQTPNASDVNMNQKPRFKDTAINTSLVRYKSPSTDSGSKKGDDKSSHKRESSSPKTERRRSRDAEVKRDKKRKRLHVDTLGDHGPPALPPTLHTGLTNGLKSLMRLPPSPDLSGDNNNDTPMASPLKRTKHSKHSKSTQGNAAATTVGIFGIVTSPKPKSRSKKEKRDKDRDKDKDKEKKSEKHSHRHREKKPKLIDYKANPKYGNEMVVFTPQVDSFFKTINKRPESGKGCSMNKALKRFHREREASGSSMTKGQEEKELFKNLRMRRNDRGEIVLFTV